MVRPRSHEAHERVLRAAMDLFGERGIDSTSMDAIAQASGVSKATIYHHWADKETLLMEVMLLVHGLDREPEDVDSGDLCRDLTTVLTRRPSDEFDQARERMMPSLIAYSALHHEFGRAWRHRVTEPPRECLKRILRRGIERGKLPANLDLDMAMALLLGPILYVHIFQKGGLPNLQDIGPMAAQVFWRGFAIDESAGPNKKHKTRNTIEPNRESSASTKLGDREGVRSEGHGKLNLMKT
jgi:AcrR family transcriptional regulator